LGLQSNALKFTKEGKIEIQVEIIYKDLEEYLQIQVIDTGVGLPYKDQDKLFKLFGFIQETSKMNSKGIGLGLVISDQIVSKFEGNITFSSVPGNGSIFKFCFKLRTRKEQ
jgi:signal transduction histidine kinase